MRAEPTTKGLHPRNKHNGGYDFDALVAAHPQLAKYVIRNDYNNLSINFFDPSAVVELNRALLKRHYNIQYWELPPSALTPPIPSRAEYVHHIADLVGKAKNVRGLDIGVGASCIYPIIATTEYGWEMVGSDIAQRSVEWCRKVIDNNSNIKDKISVRLQQNHTKIFEGVVSEDEHFTFTICNPPFHASAKEANDAARRKLRNLKATTSKLNFAGTSNELWCKGGEREFIRKMIHESEHFRHNITWFTTLVSKQENIVFLTKTIKEYKAKEFRIIEMNHGNKQARILAWRF